MSINIKKSAQHIAIFLIASVSLHVNATIVNPNATVGSCYNWGDNNPNSELTTTTQGNIGKLTDVAVTYSAQKTANDGPVTNVDTSTRYASDCLGTYWGNDNQFDGVDNNGLFGDGIMNGAAMVQKGKSPADADLQAPTEWEYGAFLKSPSEMSYLNNDSILDPGWIQLGGYDVGNGSLSYSSYDMKGLNIPIADFLSLGFSCGSSSGCTSGTWFLDVNWDTPSKLAQAGLFDGKFFDQFALVFKSSTEFVAYNFTTTGLGLDPSTIGTGKFPYMFSGTWNTSGTLVGPQGQGQDISHFSLYARDPVGDDGTEVSAPNTFGILMLGFLSLILSRKYIMGH